MIHPLFTDELCADSHFALPSLTCHPKFTGEDESLTFHRFVKELEGCGVDLEPLPLFSPPCFDTLRAVSPSIFDEEVPVPMFSLGENVVQWLPSIDQKQYTENSSLVQDVPSPSVYDVVCSRAKQFQDLPGCLRFRQIVLASIPAYIKASTRRHKTALIASIIEDVMRHPDGGHVRFLKHDSSNNTWSTLGIHQIRDKVGHALRETIQEMGRAQRQKTHAIRQVAAPAS
jgi:hypothetical protein